MRDSLGGGAGVQFFITMLSVVDTSEYEAEKDPNDWGMHLLEGRLPTLLNSPSSPETGLSGLEQIGTPTTAGQRSLELQ